MTGTSISPSSLSTEARHIKDVVTKLNGFKLDHTEYTCLKALALFKPGIFDISSNNSFNWLYLMLITLYHFLKNFSLLFFKKFQRWEMHYKLKLCKTKHISCFKSIVRTYLWKSLTMIGASQPQQTLYRYHIHHRFDHLRTETIQIIRHGLENCYWFYQLWTAYLLEQSKLYFFGKQLEISK